MTAAQPDPAKHHGVTARHSVARDLDELIEVRVQVRARMRAFKRASVEDRCPSLGRCGVSERSRRSTRHRPTACGLEENPRVTADHLAKLVLFRQNVHEATGVFGSRGKSLITGV
jgi:hypothetical protein